MKKCCKCKQLKPISEFYKNRSRNDGLASECKICKNSYTRTYLKDYRQNPENKYKAKEYMEKYCQTSKYKNYQKNRAQTYKGKETIRRTSQRRYARKRAVIANFTSFDWEFAKLYFENNCAYCGQHSSELHQEHFLPLAKGGSYTPDNIVPACPKCNQRKHLTNAREFMERIGRLDRYDYVIGYLNLHH